MLLGIGDHRGQPPMQRCPPAGRQRVERDRSKQRMTGPSREPASVTAPAATAASSAPCGSGNCARAPAAPARSSVVQRARRSTARRGRRAAARHPLGYQRGQRVGYGQLLGCVLGPDPPPKRRPPKPRKGCRRPVPAAGAAADPIARARSGRISSRSMAASSSRSSSATSVASAGSAVADQRADVLACSAANHWAAGGRRAVERCPG